MAGSNGSGKSVLAQELADRCSIENLIAPDKLAAGDMGTNASQTAFATARNLRVRYAAGFNDFFFETTFSHESNVLFLRALKTAGYEVHLYFVSTVDSRINVSRVQNRATLNGHAVPHQKIQDRYLRSLRLLSSAVKFCDRICLFDNSAISGGMVVCELRNDASEQRRTVNVSKGLPDWVRDYALKPFSEASLGDFVLCEEPMSLSERERLFEPFLADVFNDKIDI
jgi:predicted ABC-type ATPase